MGFLDRLKASQSHAISDWKSLDNIAQLDDIDVQSKDSTVVLFKHSTTCGISASAKHRLEGDWGNLGSKVEFYYLDLLSYRPISNEIAKRYRVRHESPQIIIIKNGQAVHDSSHHRISITDLNQHLEQAQ